MKNIRSMSFEELVRARAEIEAAIELHAARERRDLIAALQRVDSQRKPNDKAAPHALRGRKLPALYRNPKDRAQTSAIRDVRPTDHAALITRNSRGIEADLLPLDCPDVPIDSLCQFNSSHRLPCCWRHHRHTPGAKLVVCQGLASPRPEIPCVTSESAA